MRPPLELTAGAVDFEQRQEVRMVMVGGHMTSVHESFAVHQQCQQGLVTDSTSAQLSASYACGSAS